MKRTTIVQAVLALALLVVPAMPAHAFFVTFVASNGNDANDCGSPATACRHISRALAVTNLQGEITCVDSAEYGEATVTIGFSVTIDCRQNTGDLPPFEINGAGIVVTLKNLDQFVDTAPAVEFTNGAALILQNVHLFRFSGHAIRFVPATNAQLVVSDCRIDSSANAAGILIKPASGVQASFAIERTVIRGNRWGIAADGTNGGSISGTASDSVVTGNSDVGILTQGSGPSVTVAVDNVRVTNNGVGLWAQDSTAILARRSFITGNGTGVQASGSGAVFSYGDNSLNANVNSNGAFSAMVGLK